METLKLVQTGTGSLRFEVHARPRARVTRFTAVRDGALVAQLAAPPVDGAANEELVAGLAKALQVPKRSVVLVRGEASRTKVVEVLGLSPEELRARLRLVIT
jgi:uncharacterized protein YggU (UPF0235/DUF167 family)